MLSKVHLQPKSSSNLLAKYQGDQSDHVENINNCHSHIQVLFQQSIQVSQGDDKCSTGTGFERIALLKPSGSNSKDECQKINFQAILRVNQTCKNSSISHCYMAMALYPSLNQVSALPCATLF